MSELGLVTAVKGHILTIEIPRTKACASCKACIPLDGKDSMTCFVRNECGAVVGDRVILKPGESKELGASALLFGLPLLCFIAGTLFAGLFLKELFSLLIGVGALALSYLAVYFISRRMKAERFMKRAVAVAPPKDSI